MSWTKPSEKDLLRLRRMLDKSLKKHPPMLLTPLPRKTRFRLWVNRQIDLTGIFLCSQGPNLSRLAGVMWAFAEETGVYWNAAPLPCHCADTSLRNCPRHANGGK